MPFQGHRALEQGNEEDLWGIKGHVAGGTARLALLLAVQCCGMPWLIYLGYTSRCM